MTALKLCLVVCFLTTPCQAGIQGFGGDKAMINWSRYRLPFFENEMQARTWAHEIKYIPEIHEILKNKMDAMGASISVLDMTKSEDVTHWNFLMKAWGLYLLAFEIMEDYRKKGVTGDMAQVGAAFYAGSIPQ